MSWGLAARRLDPVHILRTQARELDPEIAAATAASVARQQRQIELIASENYTSPAVIAAQGTC